MFYIDAPYNENKDFEELGGIYNNTLNKWWFPSSCRNSGKILKNQKIL